MRVGLDVYTIHSLKLDPFQTLDYAKKHQLEGVQFGGLRGFSSTLDPGRLKEIRTYADDLALYSHVSVSTCNPYLIREPLEDHLESLKQEIEAAAACGWHELHSSLGGLEQRYEHPVRWTQHLADASDLIRKLGPVLRQHKSRINLETHGDTTTFELVRLVEDLGPNIAGICLDTANVLCHAEDPVLAARRAAPYTHLTHTKDAIMYFINTGYRRQTLPPGRGALDWKTILPILAEYSPDLPISIEDHKMLFDFHVFDPHWLSLHPDLTREELARVIQMVWKCQRLIYSGGLPDPEESEKIPHTEELEERLHAGRGYLKKMISRLGLDRQGD
ncbi:sugar phosphate isomerase/epimerase family protein [Candidatus Poribacteria bacterium]